MPIAKSVTIEALLDAGRHYFAVTHRRITIEYALIKGVNDSEACAQELAGRLSGTQAFHVNLIPVNPVQERTFQRSTRQIADMFVKTLEKAGVQVTVRRKLGADIDAACGQLRRSKKGNIS